MNSKNKKYLVHYGVPGMKWGVRRYQNYDGSLILQKGHKMKRISLSPSDPTYDNKKYLSISPEDHKKWDDYIGGAYIKRGQPTYSQTYEAVKDLRLANSAKQGEIYAKMLLNSKFAKTAVSDLKSTNIRLGLSETNDNAKNISRMVAMQTETGKKFVKQLLKQKYDGMVDVHGTNVADLPVIVLNPDKNLRWLGGEYSESVKEYIRNNHKE